MKRALPAVLFLSLLTAGAADAQAPTALEMKRARSTTIDLRTLSQESVVEPPILPAGATVAGAPATRTNPPAPAPLSSFAGLDFTNFGSRRPPDPTGDAGPTYYVQAVNSAIGIYRKSDGARVA